MGIADSIALLLRRLAADPTVGNIQTIGAELRKLGVPTTFDDASGLSIHYPAGANVLIFTLGVRPSMAVPFGPTQRFL